MAALFDQTHRSGMHIYETLASAASPMDDVDVAHLSAYHDENLFGLFSSSLPSHHSSSLSPLSEYGSTGPYSDFSGPSSWATVEDDLYAGAHCGAQQVDTPIASEMGCYSSPAQTRALALSQMPGAYWPSEAWDDVAPVAQASVASTSPVYTGALCDTPPYANGGSICGPAAPVPSPLAPTTSLPGAAVGYTPVRTAQKRRAGDDEDESRIVKRPRHAVDPMPKGKRTPPDPQTGLALPGETSSQTSDKYKTVVPEETPRERQTLASLPPAETRADTQRGLNRPTARATEATPELKSVVPGEDRRKGRKKKAATPGEKKVTCAWPARLETGKMCEKGYGRDHDMLRHVQSEHLRIPHECSKCGTYVLREPSAHQESQKCAQAREWPKLGRELRAKSALVKLKVTGVLEGERLVDDEVWSVLEAIRTLIEAGRSQPDDIEDGIDGWMKRHGKVWQKVVDIVHAHAPPS